MTRSIQQIDDAHSLLITGGDYVERGMGLVCGIAFTAGFFGSGGLLGLAFLAGAGLLAFDS